MTEPSFRRVENCRICSSADLLEFLSLGETPLANSFVEVDRSSVPEPRFPLAVLRCRSCGLAQLSVVVRPEIMFRHYLYASSSSAPLLAHFDAYAEEIAQRYAPAGSLVVEVGSNDGVLLGPLASRGLKALGIEPSTNIARIANERGLETWNEFFGPQVAQEVASKKGRASAVLANNVLAHIDDLRAVLAGLDALLSDTGVFIAEVPYLMDLLQNVEYDTIYHEHLSYFAVKPLARLFQIGGFELFDVRRMAIHGGSLRIFVARPGRYPVNERMRALMNDESGWTEDVFEEFASRVRLSRSSLLSMLEGLARSGSRVAGIGATAKGNTLLNYCGIGPGLVEFIADSTTLKQGLLTPGMHIPVRPENAILDDRPDYTLLLAWNYADQILKRFSSYVEAGGRFIHPIPLARQVPA